MYMGYVRGNKVVDIVVTHNRALLPVYYTQTTLVDTRATWIKKKKRGKKQQQLRRDDKILSVKFLRQDAYVSGQRFGGRELEI